MGLRSCRQRQPVGVSKTNRSRDSDCTQNKSEPATLVALKDIFLATALVPPILRIELEESSCWSFDWTNSGLITIACSTIADLLPTHHIAVHQSAIRALYWIRVPPCLPTGVPRLDQDATVMASGGYDGMEGLTDIRDGYRAVMN